MSFFAQYDGVDDEITTAKVFDQYRDVIRSITNHGFQETSVVRAISSPFHLPFSVFFYPFFSILSKIKEFSKLDYLLRLTTFHPLLVSKDSSTLLMIDGYGGRFLTHLSDNMIVVTKSYRFNTSFLCSGLHEDREVWETEFYSCSENGTLKQTWDLHQHKIQEFQRSGKTAQLLHEHDYLHICSEALSRSMGFVKHALIFGMAVVADWFFVCLALGIPLIAMRLFSAALGLVSLNSN